jgi:hypothetical protein
MLNKSEVKTIEKIGDELDGLKEDINLITEAWRKLENIARQNVEQSLKYGLKIDGFRVEVTNLLSNTKKEKT